jgi:MoxR-like ATPase
LSKHDAPPQEEYRSASPSNTAEFEAAGKALSAVIDEVGKVIVGQVPMSQSLLIGMITGGHVLLEGLPGLAKTLAVKTLAKTLDAKFQRVQFTPDLLPSDLIGTVIYREKTGEFVPKKGPLFCNILLADEINRAPAKVQSALLEAMAEKQVTIGETSYPMEEPFLVLATQNPIEQEGTYPLPEAQLDRFLFKLRVGYPTREEEKRILERMSLPELPSASTVLSREKVLQLRRQAQAVHLDDRIKEYIVRLVMATRHDGELEASETTGARLNDIRSALRIGASPRATLFLTMASRACALLEGRNYVVPDDIKAIAADVLRHRLLLTFDAEAKGLTTDTVIEWLLDTVTVP